MFNGMAAGPPDPLPPHESPFVVRRWWSTTAFLAGSTVLLLAVFSPIWKPLLIGTVFAATLTRWHGRLTSKIWHRPYLSAGIMTIGVVVLILGPLSWLAIEAIHQAVEAATWARQALERGGLHGMVRALPDGIEKMVRPLIPGAASALPTAPAEAGRWAAGQMQGVLSAVSDFAFELAMMLITFFFVLTDGKKLVDWMCAVSPMGAGRTRELLDECRLVARSVIGSNFLTGIAQAGVATVGYLIAGAPKPVFFGLATLLASFIPSVGTAIVALPLAGLLYLMGKPMSALFLAAWALLVVSLVDNLLRPMLIKGDVQIHGALIFFSLIGGIMLFGFTGLIVGPLALGLFTSLVRFHNRDVRQHVKSVADAHASEESGQHTVRSAH
jgi:predicted PurR-regulated permease PerM